MIEQAQDPNFNPFKKYEEEDGGWLAFAFQEVSKWFPFYAR